MDHRTHPLHIEMRAVESLTPYARNARRHSAAHVAQIAASMTEFGFTNPILVDGAHGIIAGHGRVMAARKLGMETVPVIELAHLSPAQKQAYIIADNQLALNSEWDDELLALELVELQALEYDMDQTGFHPEDIADIIDLPTELAERHEVLTPIRWTRMLISIPSSVSIVGLDDLLQRIVASGGEVDYSGN